MKYEINDDSIVNDYKSGIGIYGICSKYHIGKIKVKEILSRNDVAIHSIGKQRIKKDYKIKDYKIEKYPIMDGFHYVAVYKKDGYETNDYMNQVGIMTSYIKEHESIEIPSLYSRREYYKETGNYWWEQYFDIIKVRDEAVKHCPYCEWTTVDLKNQSGSFTSHLISRHGISVSEYLKQYPSDSYLFDYSNKTLKLQHDNDKSHFVICKLCGKKLRRIDNRHLSKHGISVQEYKENYGIDSTLSKNTLLKLRVNAEKANMNKTYTSDDFISRPEIELKNYIKELGFEIIENDRKTLKGKELDIIIPEKKIAIEYDGCLWHSDKFKKNKDYHLDKTIECEKNGMQLIHIFEDEYNSNKESVMAFVRRKLINEDTEEETDLKAYGISSNVFNEFHSHNSFSEINPYDYAYGLYRGKNLISSITCKRKDEDIIELLNFTLSNENMDEIRSFSSLFKFIKDTVHFDKVISKLDRRFYKINGPNYLTINRFYMDEITSPTEWILNFSMNRFKRYSNNSEELKQFGNSGKICHIYDCGNMIYYFTKKSSDK